MLVFAGSKCTDLDETFDWMSELSSFQPIQGLLYHSQTTTKRLPVRSRCPRKEANRGSSSSGVWKMSKRWKIQVR